MRSFLSCRLQNFWDNIFIACYFCNFSQTSSCWIKTDECGHSVNGGLSLLANSVIGRTVYFNLYSTCPHDHNEILSGCRRSISSIKHVYEIRKANRVERNSLSPVLWDGEYPFHPSDSLPNSLSLCLELGRCLWYSWESESMTEMFLFIITVETVPSSHTCFKTKASFILDVSFFPVITNVSDVWGLVAAHAERCVENSFFPERIVCVCVFFFCKFSFNKLISVWISSVLEQMSTLTRI